MLRRTLSALLAVCCAGCFAGSADTSRPATALQVHRGEFASDLVLSGEVEAGSGEFLAVPPIPSWQTAIKWIVDDGTVVKEGERVVELDNSALTADLEGKRQGASQAVQELQQKEAEWEAEIENDTLDVEKKRLALEKATIDSSVPAELMSRRSWEEKQTALRAAKVEFEKATDVLRSKRTGITADRKNLLLNIEKTRRAIRIAEEAIEAMMLRAPREGIIVVRDHPWEGRKLQAGDPVWVGFPIAMLPDLNTLRVKAALADVDDGKIAAGMPVKVTLDGYAGLELKGRISSISAVAQESRRQSLRRHFEVLVALDKLDLARMRPGLTARVVVGRESKSSALLVPRAALDFSGDKPMARLERGGEKAVVVGPCNQLECVVVSGLGEGERLLPVVEVGNG